MACIGDILAKTPLHRTLKCFLRYYCRSVDINLFQPCLLFVFRQWTRGSKCASGLPVKFAWID